jgi:hypothetical protein
MDFKQLNELLKDLHELRNSKNLISQDVIHKIDGEGDMGEEGVSFEVYKIPVDNLYIRLKITTDSYGDNEQISGIEFVQPIEKTIQTFQAV